MSFVMTKAGRKRAAGVRDYENSPSVAGEFSVSVPPKNINDNFFGIESDEGVIEIDSKAPLKNNARARLFKNVEQEKIVTTSFGTVRYDSENKPKYHGQLEKVLVSSNVDKAKIRDLNQILLKKNSVEKDSELSSTEKCSKTTTDVLDKNLKSKLASSSYVDELYFPETYTEEDSTCKLEGSERLSSSNEEKLNIIEESYFNNKIASGPIFKDANIISENAYSTHKDYPLPHTEDSTKKIADHKLPSFQPMSGLKSSSASSLDNKSNFIEKFYFNDKMSDEFISKNVNTTSESISGTDKSHPFRVNEKPSQYIIHDEISNLSSSTENLFNAQEIKQDMKASYNLNESVEKVDADDKGEQLSLKLNSPSLEDLGSYNKFMPNAAGLPKTKNNFLFQSEEFLKKRELINPSKVRKLGLFQRNVDETETAEIIQNEEEVVKSSSKIKNSKIIENSNANELPETAYDFVKKLRNTNKKLDPELKNGKFIQKRELYDSKGFRILKNQVPNLSYYTRDEILELLVKNILYSDDDLIVLNKPYNLVMHESKTAKDPCLSQYLDDLAAELDRKAFKPKLITVHRLDKETTGCLLLARSEISAQRLLSFFSQRKIIKTYWIVTTRVPDPLEGVIDMPISEGSINGRARMVLHPDLPKETSYQNHSKSGKRAVTHYKVIAESGNAALVEAKPETGIKHQIRVHFGFGLSCPILGDHKYSHLDKLAPQKLQSDLLQKLHIRQSKVRHIPMHIYARSIFIPQYKDGRNLFVMAPIPTHMSKNLQRLKFRKN
ncbi:unnamed protein product [Larinioides sclopetarius]|uniref:Pseudouridylate synthase RPUSD4, mitochondrial n=1 Tax=Larinioides sclopetarius TaxID=280406 RepID=A0AAV1YZP2_9ARAC